MAKRRRDEFVVGWPLHWESGEPYTLALKSPRSRSATEILDYIETELFGLNPSDKIFRLIEVPLAEVKRQAARERRARKGKR